MNLFWKSEKLVWKFEGQIWKKRPQPYKEQSFCSLKSNFGYLEKHIWDLKAKIWKKCHNSLKCQNYESEIKILRLKVDYLKQYVKILDKTTIIKNIKPRSQNFKKKVNFEIFKQKFDNHNFENVKFWKAYFEK